MKKVFLVILFFSYLLGNSEALASNPKTIKSEDAKSVIDEINLFKTTTVRVPKASEEKNITPQKGNIKMPNFNFLSHAVKFLTYALIVIMVGFIIYFVVKEARMQSLSKEKDADVDLDNIEDISEVNFDKLLRQALNEKNYRLAVRIQFLKMLQLFQLKELIIWKPNKTNRAYARELYGSPYGKDFTDMSLLFENKWYGNHGVTDTEYEQIEQKFKTLKSRFA